MYKQHSIYTNFVSTGFINYVISYFLASFANGSTYLLLIWITLNFHASVNTIAILMLCFWLPMGLLSPFIGIIADQYNKKITLALINAFRTLVLLALIPLFQYLFTFYIIYLFAFIFGFLMSLHSTTASAFVFEIVRPRLLHKANAIVNSCYQLGLLLGMASAGLLIAIFHTKIVLFINSVTFIAASLLIALAKFKQLKNMVNKQVFNLNGLLSGLNYIFNSSKLQLVFIANLLTSSIIMIAPILLAPFAKHFLNVSSVEFGILQSSLPIGVIIGNLSNISTSKFINKKTSLLLNFTGLGLYFILFSNNTNIYLAIALYFMMGISLSCLPTLITLRQMLSPAHYQGQINAAVNGFSSICVLFMYILIIWSNRYIAVNHLYWFEAILAWLLCLIIAIGFKKDIFMQTTQRII